MLRNKISLTSGASRAHTIIFNTEGKSKVERRLLEFLDNFDIYLFVYDDGYRMQLNDILNRLSDEEFESFERTHANRFTMN